VKFKPAAAPHWIGADPVTIMMRRVLLALIPTLALSAWLLGVGILVNALFACIVCWLLEVTALYVRQRPIATFANDGSALITALLIALALPPLTPWWVTATACLFAVVFAKHLYGGLGYNVFNPAMVGYVVVLISFPTQLANWPTPAETNAGIALTMDIFLHGRSALGSLTDALSGATPLDSIKIQLMQMRTIDEILAQDSFSWLAGRGWEWINLAALGGGLWLLYKRVIRWHIPVAMLATMTVLYSVFYMYESSTHPSPLIGLFSGGTMLAAFFVATDPVSAAASDRGRLIYGCGIGALCFAIRLWGAYPDGIAFAILLMNMAAPLIDRYTLPRVHGYQKRP
jgi:electron transport complex protein RnfD